MTHTMILQDKAQLTPDTWQYTFNRPEGFDFEPGQATELTLQRDGWKDEGRPFTMTSNPADPHVDFVIKSYPSHDGVTEQMPELTVGDQVEATGPFGAITDHGPGVFLAAGAGVTPFIAILKKHAREGVKGDTLIFSNETEADIILKETWESLAGVAPHFVVTDQDDTDYRSEMLDKSALQEMVSDLDQPFYICGPGGFVDAMRDTLTEMGVKKDHIITEEGW